MGEGHDAASPTTGAQFGKYRIVQRIGAGAFGVVYEALLPGPMGFTKRVALKCLRAEVTRRDQRFVKAMINEARIGGLLEHAHIVSTLEFGEFEGRYYLAMEFVDGVTLSEIAQICRDRRVLLPRFAIVDLGIQVCRGLHYAHLLKAPSGQPLNLVHRDIKPSNVIVDRQGTARILDFGIAKAASNLFDETATGMAKGTPRYMAPEQVKGETPLLPRADVFSLGVVLYELVTGRLLFTGESIAELIHKIVYSDLQESLATAETCFPGSARILERALERNPESRYPDALALANDLRKLGHSYPADVDMVEVMARMMPAVDRTESREIVDSADLDLDEPTDLLPQQQEPDEPEPITPPWSGRASAGRSRIWAPSMVPR